MLQSPYQVSSSSLNQQNSFNNQNVSQTSNKQQNSYQLQQNQMSQGGLKYNQSGYQQFKQPVSFNGSQQSSQHYFTPTNNEYSLYKKPDSNQRFDNVRMVQSQQPLEYQPLNTFPNMTHNTNKTTNRLYSQYTESNRSNRYQDMSNANSAQYSRQTEQEKSIYSYQINKPQDRQFLSPDQVSVKSGRRKIFSPISDRTIGSIESEITSLSKLRQSGVSNRMASSRQGQQLYGSQNGIQYSGQFGTQTLGQQSSNFQFGSQSRQLQGSQLQRSIYSPDKKKIFSPVMDYSKLSPLTKNTQKIEEEEYNQQYETHQNGYVSRYNSMRPNTEGNQRFSQNVDEGFYSPKFQDNDDAFYEQDGIAEKFYDPANDKDTLSSYQSFNHQNQSTDIQSFDFERTSPEKNSALKYLQEERVKRQLDGEFKKQQDYENAMGQRRQIFFYGIGVLILLIVLAKIYQVTTSYFSG